MASPVWRPPRRPAAKRSEASTRKNTMESISSATTRIQKPAGRGSPPTRRGRNTFYPQESVERVGDRIGVPPIARGANVRRRGEDVASGTIVIEAGAVLRPQELGLLASLGQRHLLVSQPPRVALLSTGDEGAEPGATRKPGQIYDANRFTLRGLSEQCGGVVTDLGIVPDQRDLLRTRLLEAAGG